MATSTSTSTMTNPSITLHAPGHISITDRPVPDLSMHPHDALVRIRYVGVCGSDVHFWTHGGVGDKLVQTLGPTVVGHEASGTVEAVGSAVTNLKPGDNVAVEPCRPCRRCERCKSGLYNLCPDMEFAACPPLRGEAEGTPGCLSKFFQIGADFCYKLPEHVSLQEGVLAEPLAVAVHAARMLDVRPGQNVVVFGAGTIGLMAGTMARVYGAKKIVMVDIVDRKLEFAKKFVERQGCVVTTFKPDTSASPQENGLRLIRENNLGPGADAVIEASGAESSINTSVYTLRLGGSHVQTGLGKSTISFPIVEFSERELHFHGAFRYREGDFAGALNVLEQGLVSVKELISEIFPFEQASSAWEATKAGKGIKNMISGVDG